MLSLFPSHFVLCRAYFSLLKLLCSSKWAFFPPNFPNPLSWQLMRYCLWIPACIGETHHLPWVDFLLTLCELCCLPGLDHFLGFSSWLSRSASAWPQWLPASLGVILEDVDISLDQTTDINLFLARAYGRWRRREAIPTVRLIAEVSFGFSK